MSTSSLPTCASCQFFVGTSNFGVPVCSKYEVPLGRNDNTDEDNGTLQISIAESCDSFTRVDAPYDVPVNMPTIRVGAHVALFAEACQVQADKDASVGTTTGKPIRSCSECRFHASPEQVMNNLGYSHSMCMAQGLLIAPGQGMKVAKECGYKAHATTTGSSIHYGDFDAFVVTPKINPGNKKRKSSGPALPKSWDHHTATHPNDWATELEVTPDHVAAGVKAWRAVEDPKGYGDTIYMPVFDWKRLGITQDPAISYGEHRPDLYVDHGGLLYSVAATMMGGISPNKPDKKTYPVALVGGAGVGKTEFWCHFAWLMQLPFMRMSLRPDTDQYEFFGNEELVVDSASGQTVTKLRLGRFTANYTRPCVIALDEPNTAPDPVWMLLRPCLDSAGQLVIENADRVFERHPFNFIGLAMNPEWDPAYRGVRPMSVADWDRLVVRDVNLPPADIEAEILRSHCKASGYDIKASVQNTLAKISEQLRTMYKDGASTVPWGIRPHVKVALLTEDFTIEDAFRMAVLDRLEPEAADVILGVIRAHAPSSKSSRKRSASVGTGHTSTDF